MNIKKELGENIKRMRKKRRLTQEQLAEKVDISPRNLSGIEVGANFVKAETLEKIVTALDTTLEEICCTEHLERNEVLVNKISGYVHNLREDRKKLEFLYRVVKFLNID